MFPPLSFIIQELKSGLKILDCKEIDARSIEVINWVCSTWLFIDFRTFTAHDKKLWANVRRLIATLSGLESLTCGDVGLHSRSSYFAISLQAVNQIKRKKVVLER